MAWPGIQIRIIQNRISLKGLAHVKVPITNIALKMSESDFGNSEPDPRGLRGFCLFHQALRASLVSPDLVPLRKPRFRILNLEVLPVTPFMSLQLRRPSVVGLKQLIQVGTGVAFAAAGLEGAVTTVGAATGAPVQMKLLGENHQAIGDQIVILFQAPAQLGHLFSLRFLILAGQWLLHRVYPRRPGLFAPLLLMENGGRIRYLALRREPARGFVHPSPLYK